MTGTVTVTETETETVDGDGDRDGDGDGDGDEADAEIVDGRFDDREPLAPDVALAALAVPVLVARARATALQPASLAMLRALVDTTAADDARHAPARRVLATTVTVVTVDPDEDMN